MEGSIDNVPRTHSYTWDMNAEDWCKPLDNKFGVFSKISLSDWTCFWMIGRLGGRWAEMGAESLNIELHCFIWFVHIYIYTSKVWYHTSYIIHRTTSYLISHMYISYLMHHWSYTMHHVSWSISSRFIASKYIISSWKSVIPSSVTLRTPSPICQSCRAARYFLLWRHNV